MYLRNIVVRNVMLLLSLFSLQVYAVEQVTMSEYGDGTVKLYKDISYGPDRAHKLDVYTKDEFSNAPVIFMVHGGAWKLGDKESSSVIKNKIERWVPAGFVFISINYRLMPRATDPIEQVDDVRNALITAQQRAAEWGGDPEKFILMGHSAGAHLTGLVAASLNKHVAQGGESWLGTVLLDSAALDVPTIMNQRHYDFYDDAFGKNPGFWVQASPLHQLKSDAPPVLITCSSSRRGACAQANAYAEKASSLGIRSSVISKNLSHKEMNEALGDFNDYTSSVESFFNSLNVNITLASISQSVFVKHKLRKALIKRWLGKRHIS